MDEPDHVEEFMIQPLYFVAKLVSVDLFGRLIRPVSASGGDYRAPLGPCLCRGELVVQGQQDPHHDERGRPKIVVAVAGALCPGKDIA